MEIKLDKKILSTLIFAVFFVQLIIHSYNHLKGYHVKSDLLILFFSITFSTFLSLIAVIPIAWADMKAIILLNNKLKWNKYLSFRILVETIIAILIAIIPATVITMISHSLFPYKDGLNINIINNILITSVANLILISCLEAYFSYYNWRNTVYLAERLERENLISQLESLKSQLNPHFLFNSLNTLSSLIRKDSRKAEEFTNEFAKIYRYLLDSSSQTVVPVEQELNFALSYLTLQKIRFDKGLNFKIENYGIGFNNYLLPVSIQLAVENAVKHNKIEENSPLEIIIRFSEDMVIIENNFNPRFYDEKNTGTGIINLIKRYSLLSDNPPKFYVENKTYYVNLPLISET